MYGEGVAGAVISAVGANAVNQQNINAQRRENALTRAREDTAYQRVVTDLRRAGLSPLLASNGGATTNALNAGVATMNPGEGAVQGFLGEANNAIQAQNSATGQYNARTARYAQKVQEALSNAQIAKALEETRGQQLNNSFIVQDMNSKLLKLYAETDNIKANTQREKVFLEQYRQRLQQELLGSQLKNGGQVLSNSAKAQDLAFKAENADFFRSMGLPPLSNMSTTSGGSLVDAARIETKSLLDANAKEAANTRQLKAQYDEMIENAKYQLSLDIAEYDRYERMLKNKVDGANNIFAKSSAYKEYQEWKKSNPRPTLESYGIPDFKDWVKAHTGR